MVNPQKQIEVKVKSSSRIVKADMHAQHSPEQNRAGGQRKLN